jgi:hypothetical protein
MTLTGTVTAASFEGDGSNLKNLPSGYDGWSINGAQVNSGDSVTLQQGNNVQITSNGKIITISATGGGGTSGPNYQPGTGISIFNDTISMASEYPGTYSVRDNLNVGQNITATQNITAYSDDRLKTRLGDVEDALAKVKQIETFRYMPNEEGEKLGMGVQEQVGVSAQQVQQIVPEAVCETDTGHLSVDYGRLVVLCIEAIKQLEAR